MAINVGFRFHPTDPELCGHYLSLKNAGNDELVDKVINEVNICAHDPDELPGLSKIENAENDQVWYFSSHQDAKYPRSQTSIIRRKVPGKLTRKIREGPMMNRRTKSGSWSPTGTDREIKKNGQVIGFKKTLVFYRRVNGKRKGERTNWIMHEYRAASISHTGRNYVICKVKKKQDDKPCASQIEIGQSSRLFASDDPVNLPENDNHENHQRVADRSILGLRDVVSPEDSRIDQSIVGLGKAPGGCESDFEVGQPSHSVASDYVNLVSASNISSDVKNQMQVTAAESLNTSGRLGATAVDLPPESIDDLINLLSIDPEIQDNNQMPVTTTESLSGFGAPGVELFESPDNDLMLKEQAMWDKLKRLAFVTEQLADPHTYTIQNSVYHTDRYTDFVAIEQQNLDEISSRIDDIPKKNYSTEDSANMSTRPKKIQNQNQKCHGPIQRIICRAIKHPDQMMQACAEESVIREA